MNVSVNRGMSLRNTQVLAELSKRLLALEARLDPNDPNGEKE
jgi:BMFP domain-containing protein YqiC